MRKAKKKKNISREKEILKKVFKVRKEVWFANWLVLCYDYDVLWNETGEWYVQQYEYFEREVLPKWQDKFDEEMNIKKSKDKQFIL